MIETEFTLLWELDGQTERFIEGVDYKFFSITKKNRMKQQIKDSLKINKVKVSAEITKKYSGKIIFKENCYRVSAYFKGRDLEKEINKALSN